MSKSKYKSYRFPSDDWFDILVEAEDYESAKKRYNKLFRKKGFKI